MAEDRKQADDEEDQARSRPEQDPELWDWARTAGVSREDLVKALERSRAA